MKKIIALLLTLALLLSFSCCMVPDTSVSTDTSASTLSTPAGSQASSTASSSSSAAAVPDSQPSSAAPTTQPTTAPTAAPTTSPTAAPTTQPITSPTTVPTTAPTTQPTTQPTTVPTTAPTQAPTQATQPEDILDPDGDYYSKEDVALYIHLYGRLPGNFITKTQLKNQFNNSSKNAMGQGYRIGGDVFYNREGLLPSKSGRTYTECDIASPGTTSRGSKRIVFSNDGLIYYTSDHYESFTLLYGEP